MAASIADRIEKYRDNLPQGSSQYFGPGEIHKMVD